MRRGNSSISQPGRHDGSYSPGTFDGVTETPPSSFGAEFNGGTIADKVRNSTAYKTAYSIFFQLSDKSWLNRLLAIPTSVEDASSTWFDEHGLSNKYNDKQAANYQYCLQQIQNLLSEYYAWKNSLPVTQVDQLQDAGINSAITGEGVNGSELNPSSLQSDPSVLQSSDPMSLLQQFVGTMSSFTGGLTDIVNSGVSMYKSLREVSRADDKQLFDFFNYLNEHGYNIVSSKDGKSIDFENLKEQYARSDRKIAGAWQQIKDKYKSGLEAQYWSTLDQYFVDDVMQDLVNVSYESTKFQYEANKKRSIYERDYFGDLDPHNMADFDESQSKYSSMLQELKFARDDKFNTLYWEIVDKWKKLADDGSWIHRDLLSKLLTGYSPYMSTVENIGAAVGVASDAIGSFTKIPGVNKPKSTR